MSFTKDESFERTRVRFLGRTILRKAIHNLRMNSGLSGSLFLGTGWLTPKE